MVNNHAPNRHDGSDTLVNGHAGRLRVFPGAGRAPATTTIAEQPPAVRDYEETVASTADGAAPPAAAPGPLLAVCGLCGGAGTTTLAYLIALAAARADPRQAVLVADTGGPSGGVSAYAGVATALTLAEAAQQVAHGIAAEQLVATTGDGLHVLAAEPQLIRGCARDGVELLLAQARERYALTVIDCGTLAAEADQVALAGASHVAWLLPATDTGIRRGRRLFHAIQPAPTAREVVVARHDQRAPRAAMRALRRLAESRRARLVLLPSLPGIDGGKFEKALEAAQVSLQAIAGVLAR